MKFIYDIAAANVLTDYRNRLHFRQKMAKTLMEQEIEREFEAALNRLFPLDASEKRKAARRPI